MNLGPCLTKNCLSNITWCKVTKLKQDSHHSKGNQMSFYDNRYAVLSRALNKLSNVAMLFYDSRLIDIAIEKSDRERVSFALDVGTGQGTDAILFSKRCDCVVAVDISLNALITAKALARSANVKNKVFFIQADAEHLPFREDVFDLVYCKDVLHHVCDSVQSIREMKRVAREEARIVAVEANGLNPQMVAIGLIYFSIDKGVFRNTSSKLSNIFWKADLKDVQVTETEFFPRHVFFEYRSPLNRFLMSHKDSMLRFLSRMENGWQRLVFLPRFSNYLIVSAYKITDARGTPINK